MLSFLKYLLFPFSWLYALVSWFRNVLFDKNILKSISFDVPTICVGNLTVGGTGKTPHIEFLIDVLSVEYELGILSRGYGRKTKGYRQVNDEDTAVEVGDEPLQIYRKYKNDLTVSVCEDRVFGMTELLKGNPNTGIVLLDDAYQHRWLESKCKVLLTDYGRLFTKGYCLPTGMLREVRSGASRASVIVVSKCPKNISIKEQNSITNSIKKYNNTALVFFSYVAYANAVIEEGEVQPKVVLMSGIAQNKLFQREVAEVFDIVKSFSFPDHHNYTEKEIKQIAEVAQKEEATVLMTEKDFVKIKGTLLEGYLSSVSWGYIPIKINFVGNKNQEFIETVKSHII